MNTPTSSPAQANGAAAECAEALEGPAGRSLRERLERVRAGIVEAATAFAQPVPTLIAVTKFHPPELVAALARLGVTDVGESRHPEARDKRAAVAASPVSALGAPAGASAGPTEAPDLRWHFIGQVQTNKARQIMRYADAMHAVDRLSLVRALAGAERATPLDVTIQVRFDADPKRGGATEDEVFPLAERIAQTPTLRLRGLMTVAPLGAPPEAAFAQLAELSERLVIDHPGATWRSMGMSNDYRAAVKFGATHLRIGSAITGPRPNPA